MTIEVRRSKLDLYYDIISAINEESLSGEVRPTRVQHHCNMSYDKLSRYLKELENKKLIQIPPFLVTEKGKKFLEDYYKIKNFVEEMKLEYLKEESI
ncbi:MAG: hypothetical protein OEM79_05975 [Nitrosopumilus sp.]|nr:hypothetical protein [Nitrosopumilus sp.]